MGSMSYCRFENTSSDLYECLYAMEEVLNGNRETLDLNEYEFPSFHRMAEYCEQYLELYKMLAHDTKKILPAYKFYDDSSSESEESDNSGW